LRVRRQRLERMPLVRRWPPQEHPECPQSVFFKCKNDINAVPFSHVSCSPPSQLSFISHADHPHRIVKTLPIVACLAFASVVMPNLSKIPAHFSLHLKVYSTSSTWLTRALSPMFGTRSFRRQRAPRSYSRRASSFEQKTAAQNQ